MAAILSCAALVFASAAASASVLGVNQRISSGHLGYDLQYRVYQPDGTAGDAGLPSLYVTDGQWYIEQGQFVSILDQAIASGIIEPVLVVFLDSRNPDNLADNRRAEQFMCNRDFAAFFADELVPTISREQPVSLSREDRVILGLSFGGLNSACFGLMLPDLFAGIAMQSPASGAHLDVVREMYEQQEAMPLKVFLSVGTKNDNLAEARRFGRVLGPRVRELTFVKVRKGHDWQNWGPLLDDVLATFFKQSEE